MNGARSLDLMINCSDRSNDEYVEEQSREGTYRYVFRGQKDEGERNRI